MLIYRYRTLDVGTTKWYQADIEDFRNFWAYINRDDMFWCEVIIQKAHLIQRWYWHSSNGWRLMFSG